MGDLKLYSLISLESQHELRYINHGKNNFSLKFLLEKKRLTKLTLKVLSTSNFRLYFHFNTCLNTTILNMPFTNSNTLPLIIDELL